jgi:hypothetical protein
MSCDGGQSWINDRSDNDAARCWVDGDPNYVECDHTPYSGHGLDSGDGWFFANYGWGYNGSARRSRDGKTWEIVKTGGWGGGLAYSNGVLQLLWYAWPRTADMGATWTAPLNSPEGMLDHAHLERLGTKFIAMGRAKGLAISRDQGVSWEWIPEFYPEWGQFFAEGNGVVLGLGSKNGDPNNTGFAARSTDGGKTWSTSQIFSAQYQSWSGLVFNGTHFVAWTADKVMKSTDGQTWTSTPLTVNGQTGQWMGGPFAYNPSTKTYVSIPSNWGGFYAKQKAYFSRDGIAWSLLSDQAFKGGHPINNIASGEIEARYCP